MENQAKLIRTVELTHKGLGVPALFFVLSIIAGSSAFSIGSSGTGKSKLLEGIMIASKKLPKFLIHNWNSMSMYELVSTLGSVQGLNLLWTVEEWSMLEEYHRESILKIASKIITDGSFQRKYSMPKNGVVDVSIENCTLIMLINIQPSKFRVLMQRSEAWNSLSADRFTKFPLVNAIKGPTVNFPPRIEIPFITSESIPQKAHPVIVQLFRDHFTGTRSEIASCKYEEAWCKIQGTRQFTDLDAILFYDLFWPYLKAWPTFIHGTDPDREETFHTGAFRVFEAFMENFPHPMSINQLQDKFHMDADSTKTIGRHIQILLNKGLIQNANPEYGKYELHKGYIDYFNNYRNAWQ